MYSLNLFGNATLFVIVFSLINIPKSHAVNAPLRSLLFKDFAI